MRKKELIIRICELEEKIQNLEEKMDCIIEDTRETMNIIKERLFEVENKK